MTTHHGTIDSIAQAVVRQVGVALDLTGVKVTISIDRRGAIAGYGFGGRSPNGSTVLLYIDPQFPRVDSLLVHRLPSLLAHEMHHAKRWRNPGYGSSLLEAMVSEGMADRFAHELLGTPLPPWSEAFPATQDATLLAFARAEFDSRTYNHARWFFDESAELPRWTAYTLGYRLVAAYIAAHPGTTATSLVTRPANDFRDALP